jgi:hypothetical protein
MTDWKALSHAYGTASEIPALIAQLSLETADPKYPLWEELWSRLCHQGTVYSASYAALPLLLEYAQALPPEKRTMPLVLMSAIVASDDLHGVERRPLNIIDAISPSARHLTEECLGAGDHDTIAFAYLVQAATIFDGDLFWGQRLDCLIAGEFDGRCPSCSHELHLVVGKYGFFVTAEEWVGPTSRDPERAPIAPAKVESLSGRAAWLHETAVQHGHSEFALWICHLFGTTTCPTCGQAFEVAHAVD